MKPPRVWKSILLLLVLLSTASLAAQSATEAAALASGATAAAQNAALPAVPALGALPSKLAQSISPGAETAIPAAPLQKHAAPLGLIMAGASGVAALSAQPRQAASPEPAADNRQTLHLIVGRSLFLDFPDRLHRLYVSNPTVLDAMAATPQEVVITAKSAGTSSLVLWTNGGPPSMYTVLADVDVEGLSESLARALPGDHVEAEAQQGRIHLTGVVDSDAAADEAGRLAGVYAKDVINSLVVDPHHLPQVQLEVRIVELDRSKLTAFGINLFSLGQNSGSLTTGQFSPPSFQNQNGVNTAVISDFLNLFYFNLPHGLGTTIKDLQNKGILEILAEPNLTTIHGRTARFLAGGEFPYPIVQPGGAGTVPTVTVQFRPYGVKLEFTPYVNSDGTIRLRVAPEVSALDYTNQVVIAGYVLPALSTRKAETEVELKDGQSFAISGILDHRTTDALSKMPGIADIPILGQLFRSKNLNRSTMELVVIVTPRIIDTLSNSQLPAPKAPEMVVPFLDPQAFDRNLPKK
ncbi:MAG: type II and III secretion system protein family protein [Candidatus Korobacteraceae bacterium]